MSQSRHRLHEQHHHPVRGQKLRYAALLLLAAATAVLVVQALQAV